MKIKTTYTAVLACLLLSSCMLTDMFDLTKEMSETTKEMNSGTQNMYHQFRTKESQETRSRNFKELIDIEVFEDKLVRAVAYIMGFEYQLWTNGLTETDTQSFRLSMQRDAVDEFFRSFARIINDIPDSRLDEISPADEDNLVTTAHVLALSLHKVHHDQERLVFEHNISEVTMLSMIEDALTLEDAFNSGGIQLADDSWKRAVLKWPFEARLILKMRFNILAAMALAKVSDLKKEYTKWSFGLAKLMNKLKHIRKWKSKFPQLERAQQDEIMDDFLTEALRVRTFLRSIGDDAELDGTIHKVYRKMKVKSGDCEDCNQFSEDNTERYKTMVEELLNG